MRENLRDFFYLSTEKIRGKFREGIAFYRNKTMRENLRDFFHLSTGKIPGNSGQESHFTGIKLCGKIHAISSI